MESINFLDKEQQKTVFPRIPFEIPSQGHILKGEKTTISSQQLLLLHGGGKVTSNRARYDLLRKSLFLQGVSSAAFDCIGHGETGGLLEESSLEKRVRETADVIEGLSLAPPLSILGSSMNAYVSLKLLEKYQVENLILCVPAVYHRDAYKVSFKGGFSEIIRKERSWMETDAWEIVRSFKGKLLIIHAEYDQIIPSEIVPMLYEAAASVKRKKLHLIRKSGHQMLDHLEANPSALKETVQTIAEFLTEQKS